MFIQQNGISTDVLLLEQPEVRDIARRNDFRVSLEMGTLVAMTAFQLLYILKKPNGTKGNTCGKSNMLLSTLAIYVLSLASSFTQQAFQVLGQDYACCIHIAVHTVLNVVTTLGLLFAQAIVIHARNDFVAQENSKETVLLRVCIVANCLLSTLTIWRSCVKLLDELTFFTSGDNKANGISCNISPISTLPL